MSIRWVSQHTPLSFAMLLSLILIGGIVISSEAQEDVKQRIKDKADRAKQLVEKHVRKGDPPFPQVMKLKRVPGLVESGKIAEVEQLLDEVIRELQTTPAPDAKLDQAALYTGFKDAQRVTIRGYAGDAMEPFLTRDGRYLLFNNLNQPKVNTNLYYAERIDDLTFQYKDEIRGVNTAALEGVPTMDGDGNFFFVSPRSYNESLSTIYRGRWNSGHASDVKLVPELSRKQPGIVNFDVEISRDGNTMYFVDGVFRQGSDAPLKADLVVATRHGSGFRRDERSTRLLAQVNTNALEYAACISTDGLELFFTRFDPSQKSTPMSIYRSVRTGLSDAFAPAQRIKAIDGLVEGPTISTDGKRLYYHRKYGDNYVIFMIRR